MPIENNLASDLQLIVPNLHRRYSGVTATNRMVAPKLATMFRAAWLGAACARRHRADGFCGSFETVAPPHAADLARAAQRRDDRGRIAARARLAAETRLHLGGAAASHLADALADPADGRGDRDLRTVGVVPQARGNGGDAWRRYRSLRAAGRSRGGVRGSRTAGALRDRLLRPGARAKGHATSSWRRCAGCCRAIPISPPSSSARSCRSSRVLPTV